MVQIRSWETLRPWPVYMLAASIPLVVSRSERLRWWRRYAGPSGFRGDERAVARAVAALVAEKIRVVDAPIE